MQSEQTKAAPILKWAGGKRAVLPKIIAKLPRSFETYHEPMVGGGALFFELHKQGLLQSGASISDINPELVNMYQQIRDRPNELIDLLQEHRELHFSFWPWKEDAQGKLVKNPDSHYYMVREKTETDPLRQAARIIYLNRTCFNGLYRVNKQGKFNVPAGKYDNPEIVQAARIRACSHALSEVKIAVAKYDEIMPQQNDFVYFDPPYDIWNKTSFTSYDHSSFDWAVQEQLASFSKRLATQGIHVMLSNHATDRIKHLYQSQGFELDCFPVNRPIASKAGSRGAVEEIIATSYQVIE